MIAVPLSFVTRWRPDDGGQPEGVCIPRAPGRTFCSALQDRLQPTDGLSLAKGGGILFPIDALFDYWIF